MATRTIANPFSDAAFGGSILRLGSALFGGDGSGEADRFRNRAYAENAAAQAGYNNERTAGLTRQRQAREAMSRVLAPRGDGTTPGFGDIVAQMPQHLVFLDTADVGGSRAGVGLALANGQPRQQALAVGGMGGDAGNTVFGVETASADRRHAANAQAGATIRAAQIGQEGANFRFLNTDANPGADGVVLGPRRAQALGFGDALTQPTFVPGAANIPAGNVRVSPQPGPMDPANPAMVTTQGNPTRATGGVATTNPLLDHYQRQALEWERGGRQGPAPELPEGVTAGDILFGPGYATQGLRNQGSLATTNARLQARATDIDRQIEGRLAVAGLNNAARQGLEGLRGELRAALQGARDEAAMERVLAAAEARMQQIGAAGGNALAVQGLRNEGSAANTATRVQARAVEVERRIEAATALAGQNAEARQALAQMQAQLRGELQGQRDDAAMDRVLAGTEAQLSRLEATLGSREREGAANRAANVERANIAAGAGANRPLAQGVAESLRQEVDSVLRAQVAGGVNRPEIVSWVEQRAADYVRLEGMVPSAAVERAVLDAQREAGLTARTGRIFGDPARMTPGVSPRLGGAAPAAPPAAPSDPMEGRTATNPRTGERVIRSNGQWVPFQ